MDHGWIVIPNWDKFQHYKKGRNRRNVPPWIKVYTELNSRDDWLRLTAAQRGMLVTIWIEYARSKGRLSVEHVMSMFGAGHKHGLLTSLNHAGFIELSARTEEVLRTSIEGSSAASPTGSGGASPQKEIPRDPEALQHLHELTAALWP